MKMYNIDQYRNVFIIKIIAAQFFLISIYTNTTAQVLEVIYIETSASRQNEEISASLFSLKCSQNASLWIIGERATEYYESEETDAMGIPEKIHINMGNKTNWVHKDFNAKKLTMTATDFYGKYYTIYDTLHPMKWEIASEHKNIGAYSCQKAITRFRGRNYIAWFTEQIPISSGPWKMGGLPGLILEFTEENNIISCSLKSIKRIEHENSIHAPPLIGEIIDTRSFVQLNLEQMENYIKFKEAQLRSKGNNIKMNFHADRIQQIEIFNDLKKGKS
ncbi:MAG: GLPGLI family protein [Melioribacteraceae bacterium]|nr:GLPGLI family protein [Melioribacteraceae bacterium]